MEQNDQTWTSGRYVKTELDYFGPVWLPETTAIVYYRDGKPRSVSVQNRVHLILSYDDNGNFALDGFPHSDDEDLIRDAVSEFADARRHGFLTEKKGVFVY